MISLANQLEMIRPQLNLQPEAPEPPKRVAPGSIRFVHMPPRQVAEIGRAHV